MLNPAQIAPSGPNDVYNIDPTLLFDSHVRANVTSQVNAVPYVQSECFCRYVIQTDSIFIVTNSLSDVAQGIDGYNATGIIVDGVNIENGQHITANGVVVGKAYPLAGGTKTIQLILGPANVAAIGVFPVRSVPIMSYELYKGASNIVSTPTAPSKRIVVLGDSLSTGSFPTALPNYASVFQGWPILMRANALASGAGSFAGAHLINAGYGGAQWADFSSTAPKITTSLANLSQWFDGSSANILIAALGTNDWGNGVSAATLQTNLGTWADAFHVAFPTINIVFVTPVTRVNENTPNAGGSTLPQIRTAISNVQSTRGTFSSLVAGPPLVTFPTNFYTDQIHFTTAGMSQYESNLRAAMGIY